jgi:hypothetical protein
MACRTQPFDTPEPVADMARVDLCGSRSTSEVVLSGVELLGGSAGARVGITPRVLIRYGLRDGCDLPAPVDVTRRMGDVFEVVAHIWRGPAACQGAARSVSRVVDLAGATGTQLRVRDASSGGGLTLSFTVAPNPVSSCQPVIAGAPCVRDCQCSAADASARCVAGSDGASVCGTSCSEDVDCPLGACDAERFACGFMICHADADCPPGQTATACRCGPTPSEARRCACDQDCVAGQLCSGGQCKSTCVTDHDCGSGFTCVGLCSSE